MLLETSTTFGRSHSIGSMINEPSMIHGRSGAITVKNSEIMIEPPKMFPNRRKDIEAIFANSPTTLSGNRIKIG